MNCLYICSIYVTGKWSPSYNWMDTRVTYNKRLQWTRYIWIIGKRNQKWSIKNFNEETKWSLVFLTVGNALFTMGISNSPSAESVGLVNHHEYAVLQACRVLGQYLLQLKNPWRQRAEDVGHTYTAWYTAWSELYCIYTLC